MTDTTQTTYDFGDGSDGDPAPWLRALAAEEATT